MFICTVVQVLEIVVTAFEANSSKLAGEEHIHEAPVIGQQVLTANIGQALWALLAANSRFSWSGTIRAPLRRKSYRFSKEIGRMSEVRCWFAASLGSLPFVAR